jgi:hypothetical protein
LRRSAGEGMIVQPDLAMALRSKPQESEDRGGNVQRECSHEPLLEFDVVA